MCQTTRSVSKPFYVFFSKFCNLIFGIFGIYFIYFKAKWFWFTFDIFYQPRSLLSQPAVTAEKGDADLTCNNNLGIIGFHVAIIDSCSLSLPLLLGFLCIERICVVFQNDQLWRKQHVSKHKSGLQNFLNRH